MGPQTLWESRAPSEHLSEYMTVLKEAILTQDVGRLLQEGEMSRAEFMWSREVLLLAAPGLTHQGTPINVLQEASSCPKGSKL